MGKLLAVILIAALGWGAYWFVGAAAVERGLAAWLADLRDRGWTVDYATLNTAGFPSRFDTTLTDLSLADPRSGIAWDAPRFQILALSYRPNHIIAALPPTQSVTTPRDRIDVTSDRMRGSVVFAPDTDLTLDHSSFETRNLTLAAATGWSVTLDSARLATRQTAGRADTHDVAARASGLIPTGGTRDLLDPAGLLPDTVETLNLDATLAFDAPWNRRSLGENRPNLTAIDLSGAQAAWGPLDLRAEGRLAIDAAGIPTGTLTLTATNWRDMLDMAVAAGALPDALAPAIAGALTMIATRGEGEDTLAVPLDFTDGTIRLGPVPLGPAPRIAWR